jgi:hypothetical protein
MLTPSASDAAVIAAGSNIFQICFTDPNQGKASAFVCMCLQFIHHQFCLHAKITKKM